MYQMLYISRMTRWMKAEELEALEVVCRHNNLRDHLTGCLVAWNGHFLQMLEGDQALVEAALERIEQDRRHTDVTVLQSGLIPLPRFRGWSMRLVNFDDPSEHVRRVLGRHPPLSIHSDYYHDPMLAFTLLYDVQYFLRDGVLHAA